MRKLLTIKTDERLGEWDSLNCYHDLLTEVSEQGVNLIIVFN